MFGKALKYSFSLLAAVSVLLVVFGLPGYAGATACPYPLPGVWSQTPPDSLRGTEAFPDSIRLLLDSILAGPGPLSPADSAYLRELLQAGAQTPPPPTEEQPDSAARRVRRPISPTDTLPINNFLDQTISGKGKDSLVYDVRNRKVYIFREGDVSYTNMNLKADHIEVEMDNKEIFATGIADSLGAQTRPEFTDSGSAPIQMDTITYNIVTKRAKIRGVTTQEGEGFLTGREVKMHEDQSIHIKNGEYSTCDAPDKHFYLALTRGKFYPGKKVIFGPSYLVLEDVPLYFLMLPEGFFPMTSGRTSGLIIPSYGEESRRGFFLRNGGYYFAINDYIDMTLLGSIYTLGSWDFSARSTYRKRYKHNGSFSFTYAKNVLPDADKQPAAISLAWNHTQDSKANPGTTFSARVDFKTTGYANNNETNMNNYMNAQSNSTISYSKQWTGTPFSLSASMTLGQNSSDETYTMNFPNLSFRMSSVYPFKRKNRQGKEQWYEKIKMNYTANMNNRVTAKEDEFFSDQIWDLMQNGVQHQIPVSATFSLFNYINITPSFNYNENWFFKKETKEWDPVQGAQVVTKTENGFYRAYNYTLSGSANTTIYGDYQFRSPTSAVQRIRHTITPSISFSWAPDFGAAKYGFRVPIQSGETGSVTTYTPFQGLYPVPSAGKQGSLGFTLKQSLEAKVLSASDTSGVKKISIIDDLTLSGSYNFLAESFKLSTIGIALRITLPFEKLNNFKINVNATLDPYVVDNDNGRPVRRDELVWKRGKIGRISQTGWSFGHTFSGGKGGSGATNDYANRDPFLDAMNPWFFDPTNPLEPVMRRQVMASRYYDFLIPWSFNFNYSVSYSNNGVSKTINQSLTGGGSLTLTEKWAIQVGGLGFDFNTMKMGKNISFSLNRDLHCWQMNFNWVPFGNMKSWSFNISVKSSMLSDLKYDKTNSRYDNIYSQDN